MPVFILYASPEAKSWFIADWENGFKYLYTESGCVPDIHKNIKLFFTHHLKQYIDNNILKEYVGDIENYGFFCVKYYKLSNQLIETIQTDLKDYIKILPGINSDYENRLQNPEAYTTQKSCMEIKCCAILAHKMWHWSAEDTFYRSLIN